MLGLHVVRGEERQRREKCGEQRVRRVVRLVLVVVVGDGLGLEVDAVDGEVGRAAGVADARVAVGVAENELVAVCVGVEAEDSET